MSNKSPPLPRLQVNLTPEKMTELAELVDRSDCTTKSELVRNALKLYGFILDHQELGWRTTLTKGEEKITLFKL